MSPQDDRHGGDERLRAAFQARRTRTTQESCPAAADPPARPCAARGPSRAAAPSLTTRARAEACAEAWRLAMDVSRDLASARRPWQRSLRAAGRRGRFGPGPGWWRLALEGAPPRRGARVPRRRGKRHPLARARGRGAPPVEISACGGRRGPTAPATTCVSRPNPSRFWRAASVWPSRLSSFPRAPSPRCQRTAGSSGGVGSGSPRRRAGGVSDVRHSPRIRSRSCDSSNAPSCGRSLFC